MQDAAFLSSRRFGGITRLYGDEALARFSRAHVCVVGVGGVGSWAVEALARSGIGRLTLIDLDNVAESNINRQLHALTDDFGKAKVTALRERIAQINPQCEVTEIEDFITEDNLDELFRRPFDFVIDAIDQIRVKAAMAAYFVQHKQPLLSAAARADRKSGFDSNRRFEPRYPRSAAFQFALHLAQTLRLQPRYQRKMRVPCVYSTENITPPQSGEACSTDAAPQGLSCAGYGASMLVTASFGLYCAQAAVEHIAGRK